MSNKMKSLKESFRNLLRVPCEKKIVCLECGKKQSLAIDWDYQICINCKTHLYDDR